MAGSQFAPSNIAAQYLDQRGQQLTALTDPLRQRRAFQIDAFPRIDRGLPVERKVIAKLRGQHVRQQPRSGESTLDRPGRRGCLHDPVTSSTAEPGTHMTDYLEAGWQVLEHLGDVFAQLLQSAATGRATVFSGKVGMHFARQMVGQRPPLPRNGSTLSGRLGLRFRRSLNLIGFQLFELELQLLDLALDLLGTAPELHPPQLRDQQLQMFDLTLMGEPLRVLRIDHRLQCRGIERIQIGQQKRHLAHARSMTRSRASWMHKASMKTEE